MLADSFGPSWRLDAGHLEHGKDILSHQRLGPISNGHEDFAEQYPSVLSGLRSTVARRSGGAKRHLHPFHDQLECRFGLEGKFAGRFGRFKLQISGAPAEGLGTGERS